MAEDVAMVGSAAKILDEKGRCCGRKPMTYRRPNHHLWCDRCMASFSPETGLQVPNWAFAQMEDGSFQSKAKAKQP